jgi:hypothetical protein
LKELLITPVHKNPPDKHSDANKKENGTEQRTRITFHDMIAPFLGYEITSAFYSEPFLHLCSGRDLNP